MNDSAKRMMKSVAAVILAAVANSKLPPDAKLLYPVTAKPPARNSPCPYGSGKKYKHCHRRTG